MLNSDWPIGPVGVGTLAVTDKVDIGQATMEGLWWDRPFTLEGVDIGASVATMHLISSYGARQDIRIHTDDDGGSTGSTSKHSRPPIKSWHDVDAVLSKTGARYSYQVAKVERRRLRPGGRHQHRRISAAGIDFQVVRAARAGGRGQERDGVLGRSADGHRQEQGRRLFGPGTCLPGHTFRFARPPRR